MNIQHLIDTLPSRLSIPTFSEMRARTGQLRSNERVAVQSVGADRMGEPIEMISLGDGPRSILVIGAPHPNEPIGCIVIEWLIQQLTDDTALLQQSGYRWHFIKAIEPYALQQNEGWFKQPDLATYFEHFYRPALREQAEYAFPPPTGATGGRPPLAENLAYQRALALAQPDVVVSLHNAETCGAFYFINRDDAALAQRLSEQPAAYGLTLNLQGEDSPEVQEAPLAPGVFLLRNPESSLDDVSNVSLTQFLAAQAAPTPLVLVPEVPLFAQRAVSNRPQSVQAQLQSITGGEWRTRLDTLLRVHLPALEIAATPLEQLYADAIRESAGYWIESLPSLVQQQAHLAPEELESHVRAHLLFATRPIAMARRLAAMRAARPELRELAARAHAAEQACALDLAAALRNPMLGGAVQPAPLRASVAAQLHALLAAAQHASQLQETK